jgi:hypothetical protein
MYSNVNLEAPIGALLFVGTVLVIAVSCAIFVYALVRGKRTVASVVTLLLMTVVGGYLALLLAFSVASKEEVLSQGQEKHFCELDCHLAYSIADVLRVKTLRASDREIAAHGLYYVVQVRTRFDETTISPRRGNAPLAPNERKITVIDESGNRYQSITGIDIGSLGSSIQDIPITTPLRPAESYISVFIFDLPADVKNPTLLIVESAWPTHLIVGHENSLWHGKTRLRL